MSATKCATDDVSELFPAVATPPFEVEYDEAGKAGGGLHCATLPLIRDYVDFSNL